MDIAKRDKSQEIVDYIQENSSWMMGLYNFYYLNSVDNSIEVFIGEVRNTYWLSNTFLRYFEIYDKYLKEIEEGEIEQEEKERIKKATSKAFNERYMHLYRVLNHFIVNRYSPEEIIPVLKKTIQQIDILNKSAVSENQLELFDLPFLLRDEIRINFGFPIAAVQVYGFWPLDLLEDLFHYKQLEADITSIKGGHEYEIQILQK